MKSFLLISAIFLSIALPAQVQFRGRLLNVHDSTRLQFAVVRIFGTEAFTQTDTSGYFELLYNPKPEGLKLIIYAINLRDTLEIKPLKKVINQVYTDLKPIDLGGVTIKGLSAEETVLKAVKMIPQNYTDSSFAAFSFYRQYEKINGKFSNLIETEAIVLYKLKKKEGLINMSNAFRIEKLRRTNLEECTDNTRLYEGDFLYFIKQNPIYDLPASSLNPNAFSFYKFSFDTTNRTDDIVVNYVCNDFTSESHGISNYSELDLRGEGTETGRLIIDRKTFAFKKIERHSKRDPRYDYPFNNNFMLPKRQFYCELVDGDLIIEFKEIKGKYFISSAFHKFSNDYYSVITGRKACTVEQSSEWYCDSVSHFLSQELLEGFESDVQLQTRDYIYSPSLWTKHLPSYYFYTENQIINNINSTMTTEIQFQLNGTKR